MPELLVVRAHEQFDFELRLKDEGTRRVLEQLLEGVQPVDRREPAAEAGRKKTTPS
jgi:hypothetical protein